MNDESHIENTGPQPVRHSPMWKRTLLIASALIGILILLNGAYIGYLYASTPLSVREPLYEHYHFRMQLVVQGNPLNFADAGYQEGYAKDNCNAALTTHPIHFHDKKNNFVHIHWEGMTGGQVLKYYGWNRIGGIDDSLGYRFDDLPKLQNIPIHGSALPAVPDGSQFYVYSGSEARFTQRTIEEFSSQDLEGFFGKTSNSPAHNLNKQKRSGFIDTLVPRAMAQSSKAQGGESDSRLSGEELTRLNNLIGDVVIFVQASEPTNDQIKTQFKELEPLSESSCGG